MRARPRRNRRPAPPPATFSRARNVAGWIAFLVLVSLLLGWVFWKGLPENQLQPVAAHSTPSARGRCAVDQRTLQVWERVVRLGSVKGAGDQYLVQSLTRWWVMGNVPMNRVRLVPCQDVTGPGPVDGAPRRR